jgi:hypothetical protein
MPPTAAARARFEPDDMAPTRLRWERPSPSQLEVTAVVLAVAAELPSITRVQPLAAPPSEPPAESGTRLTETGPPPKSWRDLSEVNASSAPIRHALMAAPDAQRGRPWTVATLAFLFTLAFVAGFVVRLAWLYL